jgi:hypothetical protein
MEQINPFRYGGIVGPDAFCNRKQEMTDLRRAAENGERLFVYAERRMGKTSLMKRVLQRLDRKKYIGIYVDLWPTDGLDSFTAALAKGLAEGAETRADRMLEASKDLFGRLQPRLELDQAGNASIQFGVRTASERVPALEEVLAAPPKIARKRDRRVVVVLDEFQQLLAYEGDHAERALRAAVQQQAGVAYFFLGSRKHLIERMFSDRGRPLYRSAGHYPLETIATAHWVPFIRERFASAGKHISDERIEALCTLTDGHPFYTQHLAHALWELTPAKAEVSQEGLTAALQLLLQREAYAFATRWEMLTRNQQRFLKGLAGATGNVQAFSAEFVRDNALGTPSNAQRAAEALLKLDVIDRQAGAFVITDRFMKLWIRRTTN